MHAIEIGSIRRVVLETILAMPLCLVGARLS